MVDSYPQKVFAFDPGGTTGYAKLDLTRGKYNLRVGEYEYDNHHTTLWDELAWFGPDVVVTERFDYRANQKHAELISVEYIGVMRLWCASNGVELVEQQQLKGKTGLWTDEKLKVMDLYIPTEGGHANDATRQMLWFVTMTLEDQYFLHYYRSKKDA